MGSRTSGRLRTASSARRCGRAWGLPRDGERGKAATTEELEERPGNGRLWLWGRADRRAATGAVGEACRRRESDGDGARHRRDPVLVVNASDGACVAANTYSALTGTDPATGQPAVSPSRKTKQYGVFTKDTGWDLLHYSVVSDKTNTTNDNRSKACGWDPFKSGNRPGPVDGPGSLCVSSDEFPFASTREGGDPGRSCAAPRWADNVGQGRPLGRFYDIAFPKLKREDSPGAFYVCVQYPGLPPAGMCP